MPGNLRTLASRLISIANALPESGNSLAVKVATAIITDLLHNTPVDKSQALSNWQIKLSGQSAHRLPAYFPGKAGSTQDASIAAALSAALIVLRTKKPGESIVITNQLPYIRRLNDGYSNQAPSGFVERAVLIGRKVAETGIEINVR